VTATDGESSHDAGGYEATRQRLVERCARAVLAEDWRTVDRTRAALQRLDHAHRIASATERSHGVTR
jgi:hypothetical protein